jgi:hypothetical protein
MFMNARIATASVATTGRVCRRINRTERAVADTPVLTGQPSTPEGIANGFRVDEPMTSLESISNYNNLYEFSTSQKAVASPEQRVGAGRRPTLMFNGYAEQVADYRCA